MRETPRTRAALADPHRMQLAVDVLAPEIEKLAELEKIRRDVEFLPDKNLQSVGIVRQPVDDLRRRQAVIGRGDTAQHRAFRSLSASCRSMVMPRRTGNPKNR